MPFRMRPTYIIEHVTDINLEELKEEGIKGFLFDLDNTIMAPKTGYLTDDILEWLDEVSKDFKISIVSNNSNMTYMRNVQERYDFPIYAKAKKPQRSVALTALKEIDLLPSQVAMVGDRPLTDILVGQRLGMFTILVDPLIKHKEIKIVQFLRKLERIFVKEPRKQFQPQKEKVD